MADPDNARAHWVERKYLAREAEIEARLVAPFATRSFGHTVVIPAYGEGEGLVHTLASIPPIGPLGDVLVVVVINARLDSSLWVHHYNESLLRHFAQRAPALAVHRHLTLYPLANGALLIVNRACEGAFLPQGQGVGLARKIGCDIALSLWHQGHVRSRWIHCTDADAELPDDYFCRAERASAQYPTAAAILYPFAHRLSADEPALAQAAQWYEISLHYYVSGLAWAGSPYAFHTVGSTLALDASSYAKVRGFPKRQAAEDFYILNKLSKIGTVVQLAGRPITLEARRSDRVPFGTGKALIRITDAIQRGESFCVYHPAIFAHLAAWLRTADEALSEKQDLSAKCDWQTRLHLWATALGAEEDDLLLSVLEELGAPSAIERACSTTASSKARLHHFHTWFDGFRTLKLVHALRDRAFPSIPLTQALALAPFSSAPAVGADLSESLTQ